VATLVIKNLAPDLAKADLEWHLSERHANAEEVELHLDASGTFRGTAFARYASPGKARAAIEKLGPCPDFGGRKARVELQKCRASFGRRCLESELSQDDLGAVKAEIERFVRDPRRLEAELPASFTSDQRKYAHSLAERHGLLHATRQGDGREKTFVYLSKERPPAPRKKALSASNMECSTPLRDLDKGMNVIRPRLATDPADMMMLLEKVQASPSMAALAAPPGLENFAARGFC